MHPKLNFHKLANVSNSSSIHGIYPYRGKLASLDAKQIIPQFNSGKTLLDPFCGSGTILFESYLNNMDIIGVDANPLAITITRGKFGLCGMTYPTMAKKVDTLIHKAKNIPQFRAIPPEVKKAFHKETAIQIMQMREYYDEMSAYLKAVFCGSIALSARGCNGYQWTSTAVGKDIMPKRFINFFDKFQAKSKKHFTNMSCNNDIKIHSGDSRNLTHLVPKNSVDYVFTSPPYFDALDYTTYYAKFVFAILGINRGVIRENLIQSVKTYEQDMKKVLAEIDDITKDDALIVFVVGDKKIKKELINGGEFFSKLFHKKPNQIIERNYSGTASQVFDKLNKTKRKEQIVVWDKGTW